MIENAGISKVPIPVLKTHLGIMEIIHYNITEDNNRTQISTHKNVKGTITGRPDDYRDSLKP